MTRLVTAAALAMGLATPAIAFDIVVTDPVTNL